MIDRSVIAVVNYGSRQPAEHRLDHVQELCPYRQRCCFNKWEPANSRSGIVLLDVFGEAFGDVPGCRVPGQIDPAANARNLVTSMSIILIISPVFLARL